MSEIFKNEDKDKKLKIRRSFNLSVSISDIVDELAFKNKVTKSEVVEKALIHLLSELKKEEGKKTEEKWLQK